ncbi:MAG TPA: glycosyltransferase family 39 protein [Verrucomicrobiae bacterium]|nr:glycosyltransferase family 39 protein [Verrucomicrobiae bacterium]
MFGPTSPPVPWGDDASYDRIAYLWVTQHQYVNISYPPGYPIFLALIYALVGRSWLVVRFLQAAIGAETCVLTYRLGTKLFTEREGIVAGFLLAIYPGHLFMSWRIMAETLYMLLLVLSVLLALEIAENPRPMQSLLLGVTVGCAQLVKSNLYIFPPMLVVWFIFAVHGRWKRRLQCLALLISGLVLVMMLTPITNLVSPGRQTAPLPGNAGRTFWTANNPLADGYFIHAEDRPEGKAFIERNGLSERFETASYFEKDRLYRTLGLLWIRENPGKYMVLCLKKLNNAFGLFPRAKVFAQDSRARLVYLLSYGLIAPFALGGLFTSRRRWRTCSLLYVVLLSYVLMVLLFYGTPRFTVVVIPFLLVFAGDSLVKCYDYLFWAHHETPD